MEKVYGNLIILKIIISRGGVDNMPSGAGSDPISPPIPICGLRYLAQFCPNFKTTFMGWF